MMLNMTEALYKTQFHSKHGEIKSKVSFCKITSKSYMSMGTKMKFSGKKDIGILHHGANNGQLHSTFHHSFRLKRPAYMWGK